MKKFSGVGRGLFIQPNSTDPEVGRASPSSMDEDPTSPDLPELVSHDEVDVSEDGRNSPQPMASIGSTEPSSGGDIHENAEEDALKFVEDTKEPLHSPGPDLQNQTSDSTAIDDALESREVEAAETLHVEDDVTAPPLVDHTSVESDLSFTIEPSASPTIQDKAPECDQSVPSAEVPLQQAEEPSGTDSNANEERAEGIIVSDVGDINEKPPDCTLPTPNNEDTTVEEQSLEDCGKDNETDLAKVDNELTDKKNDAEKSKIQIAANLNPPTPTTKSLKTSPDIPLLPSPMKAPGMGILGPAPNAPLLPRGPPSMFPKALPISIPPPPLDLRMPPPKVVPKTKEELLQILTEQVGIIQPPDDKGSGDQARGKTASSDDQNPKQQTKKQQYPQRQQQLQQPGQQWQNTGRDNSWRQKTDVKGQTPTSGNMRGQHSGTPNVQNRQPNAAGKKPSPQAGTKPGLSNLTKDELEKEYQWQKFSVERKIKKVLKSLKASTDEQVIRDLLAVIKLNPSKLANFTGPKEQYVVLEKLIEHAILNKDEEETLQKRIATIINSLQDMHPQGFKEDLKNAIVHVQGEYIQGTSSEFRRKQARSAGHFLGELYSLSRTSSTEFKASVQSVVTLTLKDWIKAPNMGTINDDAKLLLEVYGECLEEFLILNLRDNNESLKKQVSSWMKEEILSTTRPNEAKTVLLHTLFQLACHRCTAGIPVDVQKNQQSLENRDPKRGSTSSEPSPGKVMSSSPQQPKMQPMGLPKPNTKQDLKQPTQHQPAHHQQQQQQQPVQQQLQHQQHPSMQGSKFMSPPPSGMPQVPGRLPPGQHQMNFQQIGSVNMSVPPPNMSQPGQFPIVSSQSPQMQGSMQAAPTGTGVALQNQLQQQLQQQIGYMPQNVPVSMQTPQGTITMPQPQMTQGGNQLHTHGLAATMQMLQEAAMYQESQGIASQQALGNMVAQVTGGIPQSQSSNMSSMMHSISQTNPQMMPGVPAQQMMPPGNVQAMQYSSAGTTPGHPVQSSSQFLHNMPMSIAQQMNSSMNYQQQGELANQMGHMVLSGSDLWQQSGVGVTQALTAPISSTAHGMNTSVNRQEMLTAHQSSNPIQSSQGDVPSHSSFAQSAVSGRFVQNSMTEVAPPKQGFQQNNDEAIHGVGQWGSSPHGSAKLPDSNRLPTTSPSSLPSQNQTPNQWPSDNRNMKSPESVNDAPPQGPLGWGDANPESQEPSQQRLGTDGWGTSSQSSTCSQSISSWGTDPPSTDSWNGHANPYPGRDTASYQQSAVPQNSAEHSEMVGPQGFQNQQRIPNQIPGPLHAVKNHSKEKYTFEESASSPGGYQRHSTYTLPSKHKEGSPAAEGVSYNAMSELGSYGIDPGNSYDSASYGSGYSTIRDGGGYGDSIPPVGQKVGDFVLLPEHKSHKNSTSPDHYEISAIKDCFEDDLSIYERNALQNQQRHRKEHGRPDWSKLQSPTEKQMSSALPSRSPREINSSRRGQGRGSMLVTNPLTAMPPFPPSLPPGSRQLTNKQKFSPRN